MPIWNQAKKGKNLSRPLGWNPFVYVSVSYVAVTHDLGITTNFSNSQRFFISSNKDIQKLDIHNSAGHILQIKAAVLSLTTSIEWESFVN